MVAVIFGGAFVLPAFEYFVLVFGVCAGLPLNEVLYFALVTSIERRLRTRIYVITEETVRDGREVLVKSVDLG